ncbi:hypothetical protein JTB14_014970 [Gonioctena quinquepunctata]|nr:hypothetical protein JTB14_014970 [Gonioctena quinquepunctata]
MKCLSIAHAIIAAARPRSFLSSLLVGLAAYLHSKFGSRTLINVMSTLGFCASYEEAQTLELSAIMHPESDTHNGFHQFVAYNADINVGTLDGHATFHSMGMIDCITPKIDNNKSYGILRVTDAPSAAVLGTFGPVPIQTFEERIAPSDLDTLTAGKICNADPIIPRLPICYGCMENCMKFLASVDGTASWRR